MGPTVSREYSGAPLRHRRNTPYSATHSRDLGRDVSFFLFLFLFSVFDLGRDGFEEARITQTRLGYMYREHHTPTLPPARAASSAVVSISSSAAAGASRRARLLAESGQTMPEWSRRTS